MESLSEALARIEGKLISLAGEIKELRRQVWTLLDENQDLRAQLYSGCHRPALGRGRKSLSDLYQQGYHICPQYFARPLVGGMGCLICLTLLANTAGEAEDEG